MTFKHKILFSIVASLCICISVSSCSQKDKQILKGTDDLSLDLSNVIDDPKSPPFACSFGKFKVITVPSKYKDHTYFKVDGAGLLVNSGWIHTNTGSNPNIIYAVPKSSAIKDGINLSAFCISSESVPYEGIERKNYDKAAALVEFYLIESGKPFKNVNTKQAN